MGGWKDGRKEIGQGIDSVAKMAADIVQQFTKTDEDLRKALQKAEGGHHRGGAHT